ncbi:MAG: SPFH/Band 7/PHB domain protein [Archangiaceae bacterium]|nr:SPFH/Band 7/PHB domain protein [Archangiaceae bacterium]
MRPNLMLALGVLSGLSPLILFFLVVRFFSVRVEDDEAVLVTRFGKLWKDLRRPGLHFTPERLLPYVKLHHVSLQRDFRQVKEVHVNDARGTSVIVELFVELKVRDPVAVTFAVEDWEGSLHNLVAATATSVLGHQDFQQILCDRVRLGDQVRQELLPEANRWGIDVERVLVSHVQLLPEVSRQFFVAVAARLDRARADIDEMGRLKVARLEAETSVQVASLVAEAKTQYPLAISRSFEKLGEQPAVLEAYQELYELSLLRPHRTFAFRGFDGKEMRAADALMSAPSALQSSAGNGSNGTSNATTVSHGEVVRGAT